MCMKCGFSLGSKLVGCLGESKPTSRGVCVAEVTGPERGKSPGPLCLGASRVSHFIDKSGLAAEAAAPNALQPCLVLCGKESPFPLQCGRARKDPHHPRMQLTQGASLAPWHKWVEFTLRNS